MEHPSVGLQLSNFAKGATPSDACRTAVEEEWEANDDVEQGLHRLSRPKSVWLPPFSPGGPARCASGLPSAVSPEQCPACCIYS